MINDLNLSRITTKSKDNFRNDNDIEKILDNL